MPSGESTSSPSKPMTTMKRLAVLFAVFCLSQTVGAQTPPKPPLDRVEILGRLGVGYPPSYIAKLVKTRGVNFAPSPDFVYRVKLAGGGGILADRLSSAEPSTTASGSTSQDRPIDRLAKCAELVHSEEESAELECRAAIDEDRSSAWPLLIMSRILLDNGLGTEGPNQGDEDREKRRAFMDIEARAATLAPNSSALATFRVLLETEVKQPPALDQIDEEDLNELEGVNGWSNGSASARQLRVPLDAIQLENPEDQQPIAQIVDQRLIERVQLEPELASNHINLAAQYEQLHDYEKAISEYREGEVLEPDNAPIHISAGLALLMHHQREEALAELRDAVRIAPSGVSENLTLAGVFELLGRTPEAIAQLQEAINRRPTNTILSESLVQEFVAHKDRKAAIAELRRSLAADYAKNQDDAQLVKSRAADESDLAQLLIQDKRFPEAVAQYRFLIQAQPDYPGWHNDYGNLLFVMHKCDEAIDEYHQTMRLSPEISIAYSNMAMCSAEKKDYEGATTALKHALELTPDEPGAENNLAWLYCTADDPKFRNPTEALRLAQHAVQMQPENASFLDTLAEALLLNGNAAQALETETKALANDPENQEFQKRILRFREAAETASTRKP
jgi:tetratricopeptide (TPR) repeat protein